MSPAAIVAPVVALAVIIVVHEFGHFAAAKAFRIPVEEFSVGFGRPILAWFKRGETRYTLRPFLIGGFVRITGMEPDSQAPNGFDKRSLGQRMAVVVAGSAMNLIVAVLVFIALGLIVGKALPTGVVHQVVPDTPAARAGLQPGDRILAAGAVSGAWEKIRDEIRAHPREPVPLTIERSGQRQLLSVVPAATKEHERTGTLLRPNFKPITVGQIGVVTESRRTPMGLGESVADGADQALSVVVAIYWTLTGQLPVRVQDAIGGPVRVLGMMAEGWKGGLAWFVTIAAILSFQIGLINLFPVPALDGSRAVFLIIEGIRRRPLDPHKEALVHVVGFMVLMGALLLLTYHDIRFYVTRQ